MTGMINTQSKSNVLIAILILILLGSCGKNGDPAETLAVSVLSVTANGSPLQDGATNIPIDASIEITFSSEIIPSKFESLARISQGGTPVSYSVTYTNAASKAIVTPNLLESDTPYELSISAGELGANGAVYNSGLTLGFVTALGKTPCLTGSASCVQTMDVTADSGSVFQFDMYSNYDFIDDSEFNFENIERLIVVVHGANRNADDYFTYVSTALQSAGLEESTLLIAPNFKENSVATNNDLFWDARWREGADSGNTNGAVSSFTIIDELIGSIKASGQFSNLSKVFVTGHSSGGAFTQHYALANTSENTYTDLSFEYIVANNQYFYYPNGLRYNENTQQFETPTDCSGYTYWPYGFDFAVPYLDGMVQSTITEQQVARNTTYLIGSNDTSTTGTLNTTDCQATLLGSNRVKRGEHMLLYMQTYHANTNNHSKIIVNNVGHNGQAMYQSLEFKQFLEDHK